MSTAKRVLRCSGTAPAPAPAPVQEVLSVDLLLEIVAHADVTTVVRCAATGKILRRAILEPAFRRRLEPAADDGFDPALLYGVSYLEHVYGGNVTTHRLIHTPGPTKLLPRLDDQSLSFEPVACRDGLLVLRRRPYNKVELRACDIFTGHVTSLPPTTVTNACLHVVLSVGDAGRSFELLVADMNIRFHRTFSSKDNQWSAIRQVFAPHAKSPWDSSCSAVIGRTVYLPRRVNACHWDQILALDVDSGEATMMELPPSCFSRMMVHKKDEHLLLATVRGRLRLCVLVVESRGIAMWTLTSFVPAAWSRQVVISNLEIARQAELPVYQFTLVPSRLVGFGDRSGTVILNWETTCDQLVFLRLDLGTKEEAPVVVTRLSSPGNAGQFTRFFLHEIDLVSLLQDIKSF